MLARPPANCTGAFALHSFEISDDWSITLPFFGNLEVFFSTVAPIQRLRTATSTCTLPLQKLLKIPAMNPCSEQHCINIPINKHSHSSRCPLFAAHTMGTYVWTSPINLAGDNQKLNPTFGQSPTSTEFHYTEGLCEYPHSHIVFSSLTSHFRHCSRCAASFCQCVCV